MQTLDQWLKGYGARVVARPHGQAIVIPDVPAIEHGRTWLWDLSDYVVSSVTGGSIWLWPRTVPKPED